MRPKILAVLAVLLFLAVILSSGYLLMMYKEKYFDVFKPAFDYEELMAQAKNKRFPAVFFIFSDKNDRNKWDETLNNIAVKDKLNVFIHSAADYSKIQPRFPNLFNQKPISSILILDFKGNRIFFSKGILNAESLILSLDKALDYNEKSISREESATKEFAKAKGTYESKKYVLAMEQLRKFLYIYSGTDNEQNARSLLSEIGTKPEILGYIKSNRDKTNLKVMLNQAKESLEYKKYYAFERIIAGITQTAPNTPEAKEAKELKKQMEKMSSEKFKAANMLYRQKKYLEAMDAYLSMHENYKGTHWDLFISGKIQQMESDKEYKEFLNKLETNRQAKNIFNRAVTCFKQQNFDSAQQYYESILKFYKSSDYYDKALSGLKELKQARYNSKIHAIENESNNE